MHLLTGATGYIGGRLLRRLQRYGLAVRCLCRNPEALGWRAAPGTELVRGDLLEPASLAVAFSGMDTAFYLVHSMKAGERFEADESAAAFNFARAARDAGVRRIVYLGGLAHSGGGGELSPHMRSRAETGMILSKVGGYAYVLAVLKGSPADQLGIKAGDFIEYVGKVPSRDLSLYDVEQLINGHDGRRGAPGPERAPGIARLA